MKRKSGLVTVGLLWHSFSSDNLGVGALSESQIAICESAARKANVELRFVVFGTSGARDYRPINRDIVFGGGISLKEIALGRSGFISELKECDLVLDIGEGDSFADIYGWRRFVSQIVSKIAVLNKGIPLILSPQTIGPFDKWYSRKLATLVMKRSARVFARDGLSMNYLRSLGLDRNVSEAIDVAFRLPYAKSSSVAIDGKVRVGINVSGLLFGNGSHAHNDFNLTIDYPKVVRQLLDVFISDPSVEVWLIPHVLSDSTPTDDDRRAIRILKGEYPGVNVARNFENASEAKSFIASLDFMSGARMHACIGALSSGVPVVPIAYSRKFNGLFSSLGYSFLADGKAMTNDDVLHTVLDGFKNRYALRVTAELAAAKANELLECYENYLVSVLRN